MTEKYIVTGLVQGIGFRPSVKRLAEKLGISGYVKNSGGAAEITASGDRLAEFYVGIKNIPNARIDDITAEAVPDKLFSGFRIIGSDSDAEAVPTVPADIAVCDRCLSEYEDPQNRRFRHPFISCTSCGPRYSIIRDIPYDRCRTTMSGFELCPECAAEYGNIGNIRAHAQTIACNSCGPKLSYTVPGDPLEEAANTLLEGGVIAVKDIGGYHFVCSASDNDAAQRLRIIKGRETKPFAVMFNNIRQTEEYAYMSELEKETLLSAARPIVLLRKKAELAYSVCGASDRIGAFLPSDPVQHELTKRCGALVMTSANFTGEPIITDNSVMFEMRSGTGGFEILSHDRDILTPLDDSVCHEICGRIQLIRRARGYTPLPLEIGTRRDMPVFAAGGDLKAGFCYAYGGRAYMSQYFGDLEDQHSCELWKSNIDRIGELLSIAPRLCVSDLHPGYLSSGYIGGERFQHHYAHMASVMAEHKLSGSVLGYVFDGTGYGEDGCVWGGEIISCENGFRRIGGLMYTELLGGDSSAKDAALTRDCFMIAAGLEPESENAKITRATIVNHINTVQSSSMGRLFDAVSALLGICSYNTYEGECAILLEIAASKADDAYTLKLPVRNDRWDTAALIMDINTAKNKGADISSLALGFHKAIADAVCDHAKSRPEKSIVLSGGVFTNRILTELCYKRLTDIGRSVYIDEQVPTNDGGLALGQAWYALNR